MTPNRKHLVAFFKKAVFRAAFAGFIVIEVILLGVLAAGISMLFPSNSAVTEGLYLCLSLTSMSLIGAGSYILFQRLTRTQYVLAQSERWLAERCENNNHRIKLRKAFKRWGLWIPTIFVILACTFLDYGWALASHLFHPGSGRLIGYEVPIPLTWSIAYHDKSPWPNEYSIVVIERYRGLIKAGSGLYLGRRRPLSVSSMNFRSTPDGDVRATRTATKTLSVRTLAFIDRTIECRNEALPRYMTSGLYLNCSTPTGDFWARFVGADEDVAEFYRVLSSVKPLK